VATLDFEPTARVAFATQTTLAPDEVEATVAALRSRFADLTGPRSSDICYATQNRQEAVQAIAADCDLILVVGSTTSSNSHRLVEVARRAGCRSQLIDDVADLRPEWLVGTARIGVTAGASAPDFLVHRVVDALGSLGPLEVDTRPVRHEAVSFSLPLEVR
jgi:4-hydroxy-3-methylbut-2-enyl diphosphate reductase